MPRRKETVEPIFWHEIPESQWQSLGQKIGESGGVLAVFTHPRFGRSNRNYWRERQALLVQEKIPVLILEEAHRVAATRAWLKRIGAPSHLIVPTWPGYSEPIVSWRKRNQALLENRPELLKALEAMGSHRAPQTPGEWERGSGPEADERDFRHQRLSEKLDELGAKRIVTAGSELIRSGTYSGGCAAVTNRNLSEGGREFEIIPSSAFFPTNLPAHARCASCSMH